MLLHVTKQPVENPYKLNLTQYILHYMILHYKNTFQQPGVALKKASGALSSGRQHASVKPSRLLGRQKQSRTPKDPLKGFLKDPSRRFGFRVYGFLLRVHKGILQGVLGLGFRGSFKGVRVVGLL